MGSAHYTLIDGREAGYAVEAECDQPGCSTRIHRGLGYLCGQNPIGHKDAGEPGCGNYFCEPHKYSHDCPDPECGQYAADDNLYCALLAGHEPPHRDPWTGKTFEKTERDLADENGMIPVAAGEF